MKRRSPEELEAEQARERDESQALHFLNPKTWHGDEDEDEDEEYGMPYYDFLPPDRQKEAYAAISRALSRIAGERFSEGSRADFFQLRIVEELAKAFDSDQTSPMRAFLQRRSTNVGNPPTATSKSHAG